jgi:ribosomal protein S18 acetylase RimI-like enzyme
MEIRLIHADECDDLGRITVEAYRNLGGTEPIGPYEKELRDVEARRNDSEVYVALDEDGQLMGGVTYVRDPSHEMAEFEDPGACGIRMLAVDPRFQGRGAGRSLVEACIARAREHGRERIILHSTPSMTLAQAMYARLGFDRAPELDEWIDEARDEVDQPLHLKAFTYSF